MNQAIIYIRKSLIPGANNDLDLHEKQLRQACLERGLEPVLFKESEGHRSGYDDKHRPTFRQALTYATTTKECILFAVTDFTRAWRNAEELPRFIRELHNHGVEFLSLAEPYINFEMLDTATGKLMITNAAASAEYYRNAVSEFLRRAHKRHRDNGLYVGHNSPFGLSRVGHLKDGTLHFQPTDDLKLVIEFFKLYVSGYGCPACARILYQQGFRWKNKKRQPTRIIDTHLDHLLQNNLKWYQPFVDKQLYAQVQRAYSARKTHRETTARLTHPPLLLRRVLTCELCGMTLIQDHHPGWLRKNGSRGPAQGYYQHPANAACECNRYALLASKIDAQVWEYLKRLDRLDETDLQRIAEQQEQPVKSNHSDAQVRLDKVNLALEQLPVMLAEQDIDTLEYRKLRARYLQEQVELKKQMEQQRDIVAPFDAETFKEFVLSLQSLSQAIQLGAEIDPTTANRLMQVLFENISVKDKVLTFYPRPAFALLFSDN